MTSEQRFWSKVRIASGDSCWEWQASRVKQRYGRLWWNGRLELAHRVSWFLKTRQWPSKDILHRCDNPPCVRPDHLFEGDHLENMQDMVRKGRINDRRGQKNNQAKLTDEIVLKIRSLFTSGVRQIEIARTFQLDRGVVYRVVRRKLWTHI